MIRTTKAAIIGFLMVCIILFLGQRPGAQAAVPISISGVVNGPSGPVAGVWIAISTDSDWQETTTNGAGQYTITLDGEVGGSIFFNVRPTKVSRLTQISGTAPISAASMTQDFTVEDGYLLEVTMPAGDRYTWFDVNPLTDPPTEGFWHDLFYNDALGIWEAVLPPDAYNLVTRNPPVGTFETSAIVDLRSADQSITFTLNTEVKSTITEDPPDAAKISFGPIDSLGQAQISGAPGSVLPLSNILLVNAKSYHQTLVQSRTDGSFTARLFAPPGSTISIRHGRPNWRWFGIADNGAVEGLNPFSGTLITRPHTHSAPAGQIPFATSGGINMDWVAPSHLGAAWSMEGTVPKAVRPGDPFKMEAEMTIFGHDIDALTDAEKVFVHGYVDFYMLYDDSGRPVSTQNYNGSNRLTPSGLPIVSENFSRIFAGSFDAEGFFYAGPNQLKKDVDLAVTVPIDLPPGIYRPAIFLQFNNVPLTDLYRAASVDAINFTYDTAVMPPVNISPTASGPGPDQRLIMRLLMDDINLGTRGVGAQQDKGLYEAVSFINVQGAPYIVPMVDPRNNRPYSYNLEPFLPQISFTDRETPGEPLIPFNLPGGKLCVKVKLPDGTLNDLGCDTPQQTAHATPTTRGGGDLNTGTEQIKDIMQIHTHPNRFAVSFEQYGRHEITMSAQLEDIWGNKYVGGGTYDVWVAKPIDITPGVFPGTPLADGQAYNPVLHLDPALPADINLALAHYPFSDPAQEVIYRLADQANPYGYYSSTNPFRVNKPGEYRVDVTAQYWDSDGALWMGAMRWGGIVMSPPGTGQLIAHGRRGFDSLEYIPNQWFINCLTDPPAPNGNTAHIYNPYFNGDIVWSRPEWDRWDTWGLSCDGESLRLVASLQDTTGSIKPNIQARAAHMGLQPHMHVTLADRYTAEELPVFTSTYSGYAPQIVPGNEDQISYAYFYSERPGVRVRENIAEEGPELSSGYWRLDTLYDYQPGVGVEGDLPTDIKFQYVGIVYRDLLRGIAEYQGVGSGWVHIDQDDRKGSRTMPPFSGPGNGGWPTDGGPIITLKGQDIHMFLHLTGIKPGDVLQVGDRFSFAGHLMPTLPSQIEAVVTSPSGVARTIRGQANPIGYFYDFANDFSIDEPGLWTVDVKVWHDGTIGTGERVNCDAAHPFDPARPCPSGHILGTTDGTFHVYAVPRGQPPLQFTSPAPGFLNFRTGVTPVTVRGLIPAGWTNVTADYSIRLPGRLLKEGQFTPGGSSFSFLFDPRALHDDFPNIDLTARDFFREGLTDTFTINVLLRGIKDGSPVQRAGSITIQSQEVFVHTAGLPPGGIHLPLVIRP